MHILVWFVFVFLAAAIALIAITAVGIASLILMLRFNLALIKRRERKALGILRITNGQVVPASDQPDRQYDRRDAYRRHVEETQQLLPPNEPAQHKWLLGYSGCDYTAVTFPASVLGESEDHAFYLARKDDLDNTGVEWQSEWELWKLDNPEIYRRYREQVPLARILRSCETCLYCGSLLVLGQTDDQRMPDDRQFLWYYSTRHCPQCGWWCVTHTTEVFGLYGVSEWAHHVYGVLQRYDPLALDAPLSLAREYLVHNPHRLARFDPFRFEDLMADCLRDCYGDTQIVKLGGRRDGGVDIKAVQASGVTTLIQTKRRSDFSKRESVEVVRNLHGVMLREGVPHGMVISTAQDYSREARDEVELVRRRLRNYTMDLLAFDDVVELLGIHGQWRDQPWRDFNVHLDEPRPSWPKHDDWIDRSVLPEVLADIY